VETGLTKVALESICLGYLVQTQEGGAANCSKGVVENLRHGDWSTVKHVNRVAWDHRSSFKAISIILAGVLYIHNYVQELFYRAY